MVTEGSDGTGFSANWKPRVHILSACQWIAPTTLIGTIGCVKASLAMLASLKDSRRPNNAVFMIACPWRRPCTLNFTVSSGPRVRKPYANSISRNGDT